MAGVLNACRDRRPAAVVLIACAVATVAACRGTKASVAPPAPPEVAVITVSTERVALTSEWIATLDGYINAQIRPQVSGYLIKRDYAEGAMVRRGQVLFEIDPRTFEATLAQARGVLGEAQAQLGKTERDVERDRPLAEQHAIPQSQLENDIQAHLSAQAVVRSAQAAVDTAELNLGFTKVTSLIDGIAAIATAQTGDLVNPSTLLTTVSQVDPIKAYFPVSERDYLEMADRIAAARRPTPLWQGGTLVLVLADGSTYSEKGAFLAADREIDAKTGTIRMSALFPNRLATLRPGQYGRVRAETHVRDAALLVPQRAVTELQGATQVRVVGPDDRVSTRTVAMGDRVRNRWIVERGLRPGERVIVTGPPTRDGALVRPYAARAGEP